MFKWLRNRNRKKILDREWPESWSSHLNRNVRLTWEMDAKEIRELQRRIKIIIAEKYWEGCLGLQLTEEIQVTIAAQAGLMLLGTDDFYFDNVKTILVYPQAFRRRTESGWITDETYRSGEAWQGGPVVLSWMDALRGGRNQNDGQNLVIHEFAHALDGLDGEMGGNVIFDDTRTMEEWNRVVDREFKALIRATEAGHPTLLDHYATTNKAEFFAVASETFFEWPGSMRSHHTELFELLRLYYQVDPEKWQG